MNKNHQDFVSRALTGWQPKDGECRAVYELDRGGISWKAASEQIGISMVIAQKRYRLRGLESPLRVNVTPAGGISAAASRTYDKVLNGDFARTAAREEGISYESYRLWLARNQNRSPSTMLRDATAGIASFFKESVESTRSSLAPTPASRSGASAAGALSRA